MMHRGIRMGVVTLAAAGTLLAGCTQEDPFGTAANDPNTIVIGSQDYYSNEIIAEIYAQALENAGFNVQRDFRIGQREVYIKEIEAGSIDLFPEYSGPLLQYWAPETTARTANDVYQALQNATPSGLRVLDQADAADQDSYVVTAEFAAKWNLESIEDLSNVDDPLSLGANSEAATRPNGPNGLKEVYGVHADFTPIEDSGGPLTIKALQDNQIQLALIYTANPAIVNNNLVTLHDPRGQFLASHVVPVASDDITHDAADVINAVSAALSVQDLLALNAESVNDERAAANIARDWLAKQAL